MLDVPSITFLSDYLQGYPSTVLGGQLCSPYLQETVLLIHVMQLFLTTELS